MAHSKMGVACFSPAPTSFQLPYHNCEGVPPGGVATDNQSDQFIRKWLDEVSLHKPANKIKSANFMKVSTIWNDP